jgi:hypothetical protein
MRTCAHMHITGCIEGCTAVFCTWMTFEEVGPALNDLFPPLPRLFVKSEPLIFVISARGPVFVHDCVEPPRMLSISEKKNRDDRSKIMKEPADQTGRYWEF